MRYAIINGQLVNVFKLMEQPNVKRGVAEIECRQKERAEQTGKECTVYMTSKFIKEVSKMSDHGSFEELWACFDMDCPKES